MLFVASVSPSAPATATIYGIKRTPAVPSIFMQNTVPGDQTTQGASLAFDAYKAFVPQALRDRPSPTRRGEAKVGRNDLCPCGSGKKYKRCCGAPGRLH